MTGALQSDPAFIRQQMGWPEPAKTDVIPATEETPQEWLARVRENPSALDDDDRRKIRAESEDI